MRFEVLRAALLKIISSGILHLVDRYIITDVSKDYSPKTEHHSCSYSTALKITIIRSFEILVNIRQHSVTSQKA